MRIERLSSRWLPGFHFAADAFAWGFGIVLAWWLRYDFSTEVLRPLDMLALCVLSWIALVVFGLSVGLYRRQWRYGSFDESVALAITVFLTGLTSFLAVNVLDFGSAPRSVPVVATALALATSVAGRSVWRMWRARRLVPVDAEPIVIVGAGEAGVQILRALLGQRDAPFRPVAFVDDDPQKRRLRLQGVGVKGDVDDLADVARSVSATTVLLAIPSADLVLRRRIAEITGDAGLRLLTMPPVHLMMSEPSLADIRPISEEDLLGRPPSDIDTSAVRAFIEGKRVLVTGAGGSIGGELCRQLAPYRPAALIMLDRDESGLHSTQLSIDGRALLDDPNLVLADLRDEARVIEVFDTMRPDVVFHAAALKHLPLLERHPEEAWKSNVVVTQCLIDVARAHGVRRFVNISTDKAADPTSVLGWSKRIAERLTAGAAASGAGNFLSVRFGNVLGSRGSVLTAFSGQAARGGPIIVTHPDVTRYFMTIEEAARLTIYAAAIGSPGDVLVLDMGEPVKIADVARRFAQRANPPLAIELSGLRPGEKLHEVLLAADEPDERPHHRLISEVAVPPLDWAECDEHASRLRGSSGSLTAGSFAELATMGIARPAVVAG